MKQVKYNKPVEVLGVMFNGVMDMIKHARDRMPKDGVYVGEDSEPYPCFDSSDVLYENRSYTNLVFAKSKDEMIRKLNRLKNRKGTGCNYNKLSVTFHPMAYWMGDSYDDVFVTEDSDMENETNRY